MTVGWGGSTLLTTGVEGSSVLQLETSTQRMKKIGTNLRGEKISMGEMTLVNIGYSPIWIVEGEGKDVFSFHFSLQWIKKSGQFYQLAPVEDKVPGDGLAGAAQAIIGTLYTHIEHNDTIVHLARLDHHPVTQVYC